MTALLVVVAFWCLIACGTVMLCRGLERRERWLQEYSGHLWEHEEVQFGCRFCVDELRAVSLTRRARS